MTTKFGVGASSNSKSFDAGVEAAQKAFDEAGIDKCDFVLVFSAMGYEHEELLKGVQSITGDAPMSGGSTEGIITQEGPNENLQVVEVMVVKSDEIKFYNALSENIKEDSNKAGDIIATEFNKQSIKDPLAILLFPDGYTVNVKEIMSGIQGKIKDVPIVGGLCGEDFTNGYTLQFHNGKVYKNSASSVLISGNVKVGIGVNHGCIPLGRGQVVTKAEKNIIYEIDGQPAYDVFIDYLPDEYKDNYKKATVALCLGFAVPKEIVEQGYASHFIRYVVELNKEKKYIVLQSNIKIGTELYVMYRDKEKMLNGVKSIAEELKDKIGGAKPKIVFQFSCAGRGKLMFNNDERQGMIDAAQNILGKDIPWVGEYCFGEIAPIGDSNYFHNYTSAYLVLY